MYASAGRSTLAFFGLLFFGLLLVPPAKVLAATSAWQLFGFQVLPSLFRFHVSACERMCMCRP